MFKNVVKKLSALVAMAALCCTMTVPMTANAADSGFLPVTPDCEHTYLMKKLCNEVISSEPHLFSYPADVDGDGIEELVTDVCMEETRRYFYAYVCMDCNYIIDEIEELGDWEDITHSDTKCPDASVG